MVQVDAVYIPMATCVDKFIGCYENKQEVKIVHGHNTHPLGG